MGGCLSVLFMLIAFALPLVGLAFVGYMLANVIGAIVGGILGAMLGVFFAKKAFNFIMYLFENSSAGARDNERRRRKEERERWRRG